MNCAVAISLGRLLNNYQDDWNVKIEQVDPSCADFVRCRRFLIKITSLRFLWADIAGCGIAKIYTFNGDKPLGNSYKGKLYYKYYDSQWKFAKENIHQATVKLSPEIKAKVFVIINGERSERKKDIENNDIKRICGADSDVQYDENDLINLSNITFTDLLLIS